MTDFACIAIYEIFGKSKTGFLIRKNPKTDFAFLFQTDQSKISWITVKNPLPEWILLSLTHHDPTDLGSICLVKKRKICFPILSNLRIQSLIFLKKRTLKSPSQNEYFVNFSFLVKSVLQTSVQKIKISLYL